MVDRELIGGGYRHEAFFYAGRDEFIDVTVKFTRDAIEADEPILVVLTRDKIDALGRALGPRRDRVQFADMAEVGANPARIIPAWQGFVADHSVPGRRVRGIGEPIWATRSAAALAECQRHEALLNLAFADPDFWLLCPYDTSTLDDDVIHTACKSHPYVRDGHAGSRSAEFAGADALGRPFDEPLPDPPADAVAFDFDIETLPELRRRVHAFGTSAGLDVARVPDLVLAAHELAVNGIRHGDRRGTMRLWREPSMLVCEVRNEGRITDPLADRTRPRRGLDGGRGLWIANALCELVQVRTFADGVVVRAHVDERAGAFH
jgi:hypothetical protein